LFTDAEHYTAVAEGMEPEALGSFMNAYYAAIFEPVRQHGGIVLDVVGDAMLAIWATAQPDASRRRAACLAALDIFGAVERFRLASDRWQLPTRIGLHTGRMLLGNIGALDHYEYRAVGDIVNTASRIDGLNKFLGTRLLVSAEVLQELQGFLSRELGIFLLLGKAQPLVVHELICRQEEAQPQQRHLCGRFAEALAAYHRQAWDEAIEKFSAISASSLAKEDGPSLFYIALCQQYKATPPRGSWNGVVHVMHK
jgi:adenylate cyclase